MKNLMFTEQDYLDASIELQCSLAAIKAVAEVESMGAGFLPDGQVKILFEPHIFDRLTKGKYRLKYPHLSRRVWSRSAYGAGGQNQHNKLAQAVALDRDAALQSASWGAFQVMGFNWKVCGYASLQDFINDMQTTAGQMRAFVGYVKARGLADELQRADFAGFAYGYNGAGYAANKYDVKMDAAYRRYGGK